MTDNRFWSHRKTVTTRALDRRGHSLSQHTQFLKNNMIAQIDILSETPSCHCTARVLFDLVFNFVAYSGAKI